MNKTFSILAIVLTALAAPAHAEIYKWTDENGNTHFGSAPTQGVRAEATGIQPAQLPGTVSPSSHHQSNYNSYNTQANKAQRRKESAADEASKSRLAQQCRRAKENVAEYNRLRGAMQTKEWSGYYADKLRSAKRREDQACKLSNFR